jgi:hypothetical protein
MNKKAIAFLAFSALLFPLAVIQASDVNGTIQTPNQYAWADSGGWVNFAAPHSNIHITDSGLTGQAWIDNYGWVNLTPSHGGVANDGEGTLSGTAWGANLGWVYFTGVAINSSGQFTGEATSDNIGNINFDCVNCTVTTDWRPASSRSDVCGDASCNGSETCNSCPQDCGSCPSSGTNSGGNYYSATMVAPDGGFNMVINGGAKYTTSTLVQLQLVGGDATSLDVSNYPNFQDALTFSYAPTIPWQLLVGDGTKNVYVRFHNANNQTSLPVNASILLNTRAPSITVNPPLTFWSDQPVIISGTTDAYSQIIISFDNKFGISQSDANGNWSLDLGVLPLGSYPISLRVTNSVGNTETIPVSIQVQQRPAVPPTKPTSPPTIVQQLQNLFGTILPQKSAPIKYIIPITTIPAEAPSALSGKWNLLPMQSQTTK